MFSDSQHFDPFRLSVELSAIDEKLRKFAVAPRVSSDPFSFREFPGKSTLDEVLELPEYDPLRPALIRYIVRLTDERIHLPWQRQDGELQNALHPVRDPVDASLSLVSMRASALAAGEQTVHAWWRSIGRVERSLSEHRAIRFERRRQVHERLGIVEPYSFWDPSEGDHQDPSLKELALSFLRETSDAAENQWGQGWVPLVEAALGRRAHAGWPARLAPDTLRELFGAKELFRGVVVDPGRLPPRIAPASFGRAAAKIGQSVARSLRPVDVPRVLALDAYDRGIYETGELFFSWSLAPAFHKRRLGYSRSQLSESRRHYAAMRLAHARLLALRLLVMEAASRGRDALLNEFGALSALGLGTEIGNSAALGRFRVHLDEPVRFAACLMGAATEFELTQEYDEDWFDNPRAQEHLRAELSRPARVDAPRSQLVLGKNELKTAIFSGL